MECLLKSLLDSKENGMTSRTNLKLVESVAFERREGALWSEEGSYTHSLHQVIGLPNTTSTELIAYFLDQYSQKGDVVLDPFCGGGAVGLESNLHGRIAYLSDTNPLAVKVARAKLEPADITEITLKLQLCNVRRPINLAHFTDTFKQFFDIDTFRELVNLKVYIRDNYDRVGRFLELLGMGLLHGHSAGYFSVYTSSQISLSPEEQEKLNIKRGQMPDYRATLPRLLRRAAGALRDGIPSQTRMVQSKNRCAISDARDLSYLPSSSIDLTITTPPLPGAADPLDQMWLRSWFAGVAPRSVPSSDVDSLNEWSDCMNASLLEIARVSKPGARAVLDLREVKIGKESVQLDEVLKEDVHSNLSRYWDAEAIVVNKPKHAVLKNKERDLGKEVQSNRVLVLRRR